MAIDEAVVETKEYRVVLVQPESRKILAREAMEGYRLPSVRIPLWTRPAEQLRKAIKAVWGLYVMVVEFIPMQDGFPCCVVASLLCSDANSDLRAVALEKISNTELSEQQRVDLDALLSGTAKNAFSQIGWIDEAIAWMEGATQRRLSSKSDIEQYNAGGSFALLRFCTEDGRYYWMKATGDPNMHEAPITKLLSELGGAYLPQLISFKPAWNAWLMSGETRGVADLPTEPYAVSRFLETAVESMAELQMRTEAHRLDLLNAGAFDQGIEVFQSHSEALFDYLEEAMSLQTSTKVPLLERSRLREIRVIFDNVCRRMEDLGLPQTIVHGDMNRGNILIGRGRCQFIDWSEAYVSNPLISLQHLLLLNQVESPELRAFIGRILKERYRTTWLRSCHPATFEKGFAYMALLAIASALYGRGDWLTSAQRNEPQRQSYARSLARHMDRAAREPDLLEALCR